MPAAVGLAFRPGRPALPSIYAGMSRGAERVKQGGRGRRGRSRRALLLRASRPWPASTTSRISTRSPPNRSSATPPSQTQIGDLSEAQAKQDRLNVVQSADRDARRARRVVEPHAAGHRTTTRDARSRRTSFQGLVSPVGAGCRADPDDGSGRDHHGGRYHDSDDHGGAVDCGTLRAP